MDVSSVSVLWCKQYKPLGKVRRRVQDLRVPSSSYIDCLAARPALDLSHNESARLAVDCLLGQGIESYHQMLKAEGEVDFLSELEKRYILDNGTDGNTDDPGSCDGKDFESFSAASCSAQSTDIDPTVEDVQVSDSVVARPSVEIYFQCDSKAAGLKDLLREFIRKANVALAIVMDVFSDVELLCDLLEASRKRNVSVYLLLDHLNLNLFLSMWQDLKLNSNDFPKLSVRSVKGQTYCAKSGKKLIGEIAENLVIADWTEVLTGSYSFSWLSWQVHRSLGVLVKGNAVAPFHQEFHRLYFSSTPVPGFVTFISPPLHASHATQQTKTRRQLTGPEDVQYSQVQTKIQLLPNPESPELEHSKDNNQLPHKAAVDEHTKPVVPPGTQQGGFVETPKRRVGVSTLHDMQTHVVPLRESQKPVQSRTNCMVQTQVSNIQSQLVSLNISNITENEKVQELNCLRAANPPHQPHRTVRYQSTLKKHLRYHPSENPTQMIPSTSQQEQTPTNLQVLFSQSGRVPSGFEVSSLGAKRHGQPPLTTDGYGLELTPRAGRTQLNPRLHANAKVFLPGATAKRHLQPHTSLHWTPRSHAVRTRPVARTSSFDTTYGAGQTSAGLLGWRSPHRNMTSLGRSKSLTERCTTRLHPNITTI